MITTLPAVLRKYSDIIKEADEQDWTPEQENNYDQGGEFPDTSLPMTEPKVEPDNDFSDSGSPVEDLAGSISDALKGYDSFDEIRTAIQQWLSENNYELTPVNGLTNKEGNV